MFMNRKFFLAVLYILARGFVMEVSDVTSIDALKEVIDAIMEYYFGVYRATYPAS